MPRASNLPDNIDHFAQITLNSGEKLTPQQSAAVTLLATTDLTKVEIAKQAGYHNDASLRRFLTSDKGRAGGRIALLEHTSEAGALGLRTLKALATKAKSEKVRYDAAAKLVDLAGIKHVAEEQQSSVNGREVSINISIGQNGKSEERDVTPVEIGPDFYTESDEQGGVGENTLGGSLGDPETPAKTQSSKT